MMEKAIIGKKIGMTQIFDEAGRVVPVTVIEAGPCTVMQKKTTEKDGYNAIQMGFQNVPERKLTKAEAGHQKKAGITEVKKIAGMAEAYDVALAPHCPLGPIALAACLNIDATSYNAVIQEQSMAIHYNEGHDVLDYVQADRLKNRLTSCKAEHRKLEREIRSQLDRFHDDGKAPNPMAKSMSWVKTNMKLAMDESDATIADLMTDGCNMGVKSLNRYLNQYEAASERTKDIAKKLINIEKNLADNVCSYL